MQPAGPTSIPRSSSPVLLADGCAFGRRQVRKVLADLGFGQVYEAADGAEAVGILDAVRPRLAVLDWDLKVIGAADVLELVRSGGAEGHAPPVLVTMAYPSRAAVEQAVFSGIGHIVAKPYCDRTMRSRLSRLAAP